MRKGYREGRNRKAGWRTLNLRPKHYPKCHSALHSAHQSITKESWISQRNNAENLLCPWVKHNQICSRNRSTGPPTILLKQNNWQQSINLKRILLGSGMKMSTILANDVNCQQIPIHTPTLRCHSAVTHLRAIPSLLQRNHRKTSMRLLLHVPQ